MAYELFGFERKSLIVSFKDSVCTLYDNNWQLGILPIPILVILGLGTLAWIGSMTVIIKVLTVTSRDKKKEPAKKRSLTTRAETVDGESQRLCACVMAAHCLPALCAHSRTHLLHHLPGVTPFFWFFFPTSLLRQRPLKIKMPKRS